MKPEEALDKAADIIDKNGKCEEFYHLAKNQAAKDKGVDLGDTYCSIGALRMALWGKTDLLSEELVAVERRRLVYERAMKALAEAMTEQFGGCVHDGEPSQERLFPPNDAFHLITCINDKLATKDDVVACMQKAAQHLRDAQP